MTLIVWPPIEDDPWPTLGPLLCGWIEENLVHGPGDLLGVPVRLTPEQRGWMYRMYEICPRGHPREGQRRFERCVLSLRKGSAKTEYAAWIAGAELHPRAPVRFAGWNGDEPDGQGVIDPYIPMISYTEEQTEELAYGALRRILEYSRVARDFDIGLERIVRIGGEGKAEAVSGSPNARDGARTTFQHADETHRFTLPKLKTAWRDVMLANMAKRPLADPWALETTTAPEPGAGSLAESTMDHAVAMLKKGDPASSRLFFFHREASAKHDISTTRGLKRALKEAAGPYVSKWSPLDRIVGMFRELDADVRYLERVYTNRRTKASDRAFDAERWKELARPDFVVPEGSVITLGFDGSRYNDATGLVGTHIESGFQWKVGVWERPAGLPKDQPWEVPVAEVDELVSAAFERWVVARMYCDPPKWESWVATWAGRYGKDRVVEWWTNRRKAAAYATRAYAGAIDAGELTHDGDPTFTEHVGNARRHDTGLVDEEETPNGMLRKPLWVLRKERPDSPKKIDLAMAGVLSWEARNDALTAGEAAAVAWELV